MTKQLTLPRQVPGDCYRFKCAIVRTNYFTNSVVLDIDGDLFEIPTHSVTLGKIDGELYCDVKEKTAKQIGLI